ncbi:MAG TPA: DUF1330 domain-containing protein [Pseudolabrys sp.]|nr:DUF1330 domain-containing protein [Pseudolabrys sp.]
MRYLVASGLRSVDLPPGCRTIADGEMVSFEQPWSFGAPLIAQVDDAADLAALKSKPAVTAFLVEGIAPSGAGQAFAIGAHRMRDADAFKPYAARVPDVSKDYGCRYIARGGAVTPLCGSFVPDRAVLMEFPSADDVVAFYFSAAYASLLRIRLKATEPRFVLVARIGALPEHTRRMIADGLGKV